MLSSDLYKLEIFYKNDLRLKTHNPVELLNPTLASHLFFFLPSLNRLSFCFFKFAVDGHLAFFPLLTQNFRSSIHFLATLHI